MPTLINRPIVPQNNGAIIAAIHKNASIDFQRRIPEPTKADLKSTVENLLSPTNKPQLNEFVDALVNRIGLVIFRQTSWSNPLAKFKRGQLEYGDTIEEIMAGLVEAKVYDTNRQSMEMDVFGQERPNVQANYHKLNRKNKYKITISDVELRKAFLDEYGLYNFTAQLMAAPNTSDQWDEYLTMSNLFRENYDNGGFFKVNIPDISAPDSDGADSRYALRRMREFAGNLGFISTKYNPAGMPVAAPASELELFITPEGLAAMDVEALAGAFNVGYAEFDARKTLIRSEDLRIPGAQAILTTRDFFVCADYLFETTSIYNPDGLYSNYWLHHQEVISMSRFAPAILFTTEPGTVIELADTPVTSIETPTIVDANGDVVTKVERGQTYQVGGLAKTTPEGGYNDAVVVTLGGSKSPDTRVTQSGVFYVSVYEQSDSLTVSLTATDDTEIKAASVTVGVVGDRAQLWPDPQVLPDADKNGLVEVVPEDVPVAPTSGANKNKAKIPEVVGVDYKDGATVVSGTTITLTANKTITAVAQSGYEIKPGSTASWNLIFTA